MHLPPDAVRDMAYEDVIGLVAYARKEAEELEKDSPSSQRPSPGAGTTRRLKKR